VSERLYTPVWREEYLVDTSVWVDHLRSRSGHLATLLEAGRVLCHPFILGEIASLKLRRRVEILDRLTDLPQVAIATDSEVIDVMESQELRGDGLSWVDLYPVASVLLSTCYLWTFDPLLHSTAHMLNVSA
jgi:predicted nucleic acid-binding protein